jgi:hypothetical protein
MIGGGDDDLQENPKLASNEQMQGSCLREMKDVLLENGRWYA